MSKTLENDQRMQQLTSILSTNKILSSGDISQITTRYRAKFYALALDFLWRKFRVAIKDFYRDIDPNLINMLLFVPQKELIEPFSCEDIDLLLILGIIDHAEWVELLKVFIEVQNNISNPTLSERRFLNILELCMRSLFSKDLTHKKEKLFTVGQKLLNTNLSSDPELLECVTRKQYIPAAIKYLLYAYQFERGCDHEVIKRNLLLLVANGWIDLKYEDKLALGYLAICGENEGLENLCQMLLNFSNNNFVANDGEGLANLILCCKRVINSYYSFKYREYLPDALYNLSCIKHCPIQYTSLYIGSALLCLIGEKIDHNENTKAYAERVLRHVDSAKLEYYFNYCLCTDYNVLLCLTLSREGRLEFSKWLKSLDLKSVTILDPDAQRLISLALMDNYSEVLSMSKDLLYR